MSQYHQFKTIGEMLDTVYGGSNQIAKTDAPVLTSTTGVLNVVFGAMAFNQLNSESNGFALLPKYPWQHSGWRAITADAGSAASGRVAENAAIPDTIKPTFAEITVTVGEVAHTFEVSMRHEGLVKKGDDAIGDLEFLRNYNASMHVKRINEQLFADTGTTIETGFESIDRVTADTAGASAGLYDAGDEDIYGIDRSANSWADAHVSHNSTTDRVLTPEIIEDAMSTVKNQGGRTNLVITGDDTLFRIYSLYNNQVRYAGVLQKNELIQIGVNGVQTDPGGDFGMRVALLYGIPLFSSQAVQKDTISRIYLLDTTEQEGTGVPRLGISMLWPTLYMESGMAAADQNPFGHGKLGTTGMYYTAGQLVCTMFAAQGSIRDLK